MVRFHDHDRRSTFILMTNIVFDDVIFHSFGIYCLNLFVYATPVGPPPGPTRNHNVDILKLNPFVCCNYIADASRYQSNLLIKCAEHNLEYRETLLEKAKLIEKKQNTYSDRNEYVKVLKTVDSIFFEIEKHLKSHGKFANLKLFLT